MCSLRGLLAAFTRLTCSLDVVGHSGPTEVLHDLVLCGFGSKVTCYWCGVCNYDHFLSMINR